MLGLLFTFFLTIVGSVYGLFSPYVGFLAYVALAILKPTDLWYWSVPSNGSYSLIVAVSFTTGWLIKGCGNWEFGKARGVVWSLVGYWFWSVVCTPTARDTAIAWDFDIGLFKIVLPCFVGLTLIDNVAKLKQLAWTICVSYGFLAYEFNLSYFNGYNRLLVEGFATMDNNSMAIALVTATGVSLFLCLASIHWWQKAIAITSALFCFHSVLFSFSRGGMLGLAAVGIIAFILIPKRPREYFIFAILLIVAIRLAGPQVRDRFATTFSEQQTRDASAESRIGLWIACVELTVSHPVLGIGPRNFPAYAHEFGFRPLKEAHTTWLVVAAQTGVVGIGLIGGFYVLCMSRLFNLHRHPGRPLGPWVVQVPPMVISGLGGFIVSAQFVSMETLEVPYYVCLLGAGTLKLASAKASVMRPLPLQRLATSRNQPIRVRCHAVPNHLT